MTRRTNPNAAALCIDLPEVVKSFYNLADKAACEDADWQAEMLVCLDKTIRETPDFYWAMQCRAIAEAMTSDECDSVRRMLDDLMDHLEAVPQERRVKEQTAAILA